MLWPIGITFVVTLSALALRRTRWAAPASIVSRCGYFLFVVLGLLYFPWQSGFHVAAPSCEWTFDAALAVHSLGNYKHIVLFTLFFFLTYTQFSEVRRPILLALAACIAMGLLVELAQGASRYHHCRMRDLIPDATGALAGALLVVAGRKLSSAPRAISP